MRTTVAIVSAIFLLATNLPALAAPPASCKKAAENAVVKKFRDYFFDNRGKRLRVIEDVSCVAKTSKKKKSYVECEVSASTGDGAGDATFAAIFTKTCKKNIATFLVGEE